jgi:alpha-tubulin suppressor-like RCC1 family protein
MKIAVAFLEGVTMLLLGCEKNDQETEYIAYTSIAAGKRFSLAVKADGTLWAWGKNDYGQL